MEHVVFSAAPGAGDTDGPAGEEFRRVASLEEALRVVEHLRNDVGITDASVFALTPVPLAFRAYYRVEVPGVEVPVVEVPGVQVAALEAPAAELPPLPEETPAMEPIMEPVMEMAAEPAAEEPGEFSFDAATGMTVMASELAPHLLAEPVPALLPSASDIPLSRQDGEPEHSLGYFAR
jgi:hypothetical protein